MRLSAAGMSEGVILNGERSKWLTALDVPILHSHHHHCYFHKGLCVDDYPANVDDLNHPIKSNRI